MFHMMECDIFYDSHPPYLGPGDRCSRKEIAAGTATQFSILGMSTSLCGKSALVTISKSNSGQALSTSSLPVGYPKRWALDLLFSCKSLSRQYALPRKSSVSLWASGMAKS